MAERTGRARRRDHERVLDPLLGPHNRDHGAGRLRRASRRRRLPAVRRLHVGKVSALCKAQRCDSDEDALRNSLASLSARVTRLPAMTVRTTEPIHLSHRRLPFAASSRDWRPAGRRGCAFAGSRRSQPRSVWCRRSSPTSARSRDDPIRASGSGPWSGCATTARAGLVDRVENVYYSLTAPSKGGPPLRALPTQSGAVAVTPVQLPQIRYRRPRIRHYRPPQHRAADPSGASGRGRLAHHVRQRRRRVPRC